MKGNCDVDRFFSNSWSNSLVISLKFLVKILETLNVLVAENIWCRNKQNESNYLDHFVGENGNYQTVSPFPRQTRTTIKL